MLTLLTRLHHTRLRFPQIPPHQICCSYTLPHSPSLYLILSHFYSKENFLSHGCFSTSSLHLPLSPSHLFIYLTFSSAQLITSLFHLPLSLTHHLNSLTSSSLQLIAPLTSYLNPMLGFFICLPVVPMVLLCF